MLPRAHRLALVLLLFAFPAWAGNGHYLHGVGAKNSAMGGAGTGLAVDVIGALHANPALLTQLDEFHVEISAEIFADDLSMTAPRSDSADPVNDRVTTDSDGEIGVLPALGWSYHKPGSRKAYGWGLLAVAGFRTNWPSDPNNTLIRPQPIGFGRLQTELAVSKIPFALAWQVNNRLSLGASLNVYVSRLSIQPLPVVVQDCTDAMGNFTTITADARGTNCYRPDVSVPTTEFSLGLQVGLFYQFNPQWSFGFSYTTPQDNDPFTWQSEHANPDVTTGAEAFGNPREISIDIDYPAIASVGLGFRPTPQTRFAFDVRWVGYNTENGIGGSGGIDPATGILISIGWQDIWAVMLGVEHDVSPTFTVRGGLNFNESPITNALALNSAGTPSVFEEHYTLGASWQVHPKMKIDLGAYYTPPNDITGPLQFAPGNITLTNEILAGLVGFSFHF